MWYVFSFNLLILVLVAICLISRSMELESIFKDSFSYVVLNPLSVFSLLFLTIVMPFGSFLFTTVLTLLYLGSPYLGYKYFLNHYIDKSETMSKVKIQLNIAVVTMFINTIYYLTFVIDHVKSTVVFQ